MQKILDMVKNININLTDVLIYAVIALVTIVGFIKCIMPIVRRTALIKRATRSLKGNSIGEKPAWQEVGFLGKPFRNPWRRFLVNAEQLELRGLNCDVEDYINDETVVHEPGNSQLAELIPSLLTSLGILGTFIGLMRGLGGLDMTNASKIMEGIPTLIDGMKFAFATSVAGIACSLGFNIIHRLAMGSAYKTIDGFVSAFTSIVMQRPVDFDIQLVIQNQDQNMIIRQASEEAGNRMAASIEGAVTRVMQPITQSMDNFIVGATREQMEGVQRITHAFIQEMNRSLSGQFLQLGQILNDINQSQSMSHAQLESSVHAAQAIVDEVENMQRVSGNVMKRFEEYVVSLENSKEQGRQIDGKREELFRQMQQSNQDQSLYLQQLKGYQAKLETALQDFTAKSERNLMGMAKETQTTTQELADISQRMRKDGELLEGSYSSFVENVAEGLSRSLGMFDQNINQVINQLNESLTRVEKSLLAVPEKGGKTKEDAGYLALLSSLQQSLAGIEKALNTPKAPNQEKNMTSKCKEEAK